MGRPKTNRNVRLELRLTEAENALLTKCSEITNRTRTEVIVKGISMVYKELQNK